MNIIKFKNEDNKCFMWSILASLFPVSRNPNRVSKYENNLDFEDIIFSTNIFYFKVIKLTILE